MRVCTPALAALAVLAVSGCGNAATPTYTPAKTAPCLTRAGFRVATGTAAVGLIAATAVNGGLRARRAGADVTISFGADSADAARLEGAYRLHAPAPLRLHFGDISQLQHNALLVWTVTPTTTQSATVAGCLK